jgi:hypothetical protein
MMRFKRWQGMLGGLFLAACMMINHPLMANEGEGIVFEKETIRFAIKKLGVRAGEASLSYEGLTELDGKVLVLIVFRAQGMKFFDEERIYMDPQTFYPLRVERSVNVFGKKENIVEIYDPVAGQVRIVKDVKGSVTEQVFSGTPPLDNIYCFIYRYRQKGKFAIGDSLTLNLPTRQIQIHLVETATLSLNGKKHEAFFMESEPRQYRVWFGSDSKKIPLRIDGAVGFGQTSMMMVEHL